MELKFLPKDICGCVSKNKIFMTISKNLKFNGNFSKLSKHIFLNFLKQLNF